MQKLFTFFVLLILANFILEAQTPVKRVLLEEFSTAPCGFCPEGGIIAEQLLKKYPELITFTHHAGFGTDSMTIGESKTIAGKFTNFAPAAVIDRNYHKIPVYTYPEYLAISRQKWDSIVAIHLNETPEADISITKLEFQNDIRQIKLDFTVKFLKDFPTDDYRYNVAIIEDSVSGIGKGWDQKNYFNGDPKYPDLYKKGDSIVGYIHRHVVRMMPYGAWGSNANFPKTITANYEMPISLTLDNLPARWKMKDCKVLVFLSKYSTSIMEHKVYNSIEMKVPYSGNSIEENGTVQNNFGVYPNPVSDLGYIHLAFENATQAKLELYSAFGAKIRDIASGNYQKSQNVYFYTSDLAPGAYFIKVEAGNQIKYVRFIVE